MPEPCPSPWSQYDTRDSDDPRSESSIGPQRHLVVATARTVPFDGPIPVLRPEDEPKGPRVRREREAKRICSQCPVVDQCRTYALSAGERYGVWGGTSEDDRRQAAFTATSPTQNTA
ncbi:WhiB family transcriptional regulator [Rhodococcus sp. NPDC059968]|uniref:WhiB family transcriptional regulator n=1 Tax=Rhodococcus sp. NPDC059968 TaxID=3347017 RepID=UPI00366F46B4